MNSTTKYLNEGLSEVLGGGKGQDNLQVSDTTNSQIKECIDTFGLDCTLGMLQRAGRAGLYYWLRDQSDSLGWRLPEFRLLSFRRKLRRGMEDITAWLEKNSTDSFEVTTGKDKMVIRVAGSQPDQFNCAFFLGLFQEYFSWIASGKFFPATVVQSDSQSLQVFEISMKPLD
jgi:hypothetical protein